MKFKGFAGMDRSGSSGNFPLVIATIISRNKSQINECYESIFRFASKINPIFSSRREIKSRDFNSTHSRMAVLNKGLCIRLSWKRRTAGLRTR